MKIHTKSLAKRFLLVSFLSALLISCGGSPETVNAIPKDTAMLGIVNVQALIDKADVASLLESKEMLAMMDKMKESDEESYKFITELIANPNSSGLDLTQDVFVFSDHEKDDLNFASFVFTLDDKSDFKHFLLALVKLDGGVSNLKEIEMGTFDYYQLAKDALVGFDDDKVIFISQQKRSVSRTMEEYAQYLFNLKADQSINTSADFQSFYAEKKDVNVFYAADFYRELAPRDFETVEQELQVDLSNMHYGMALNFDAGQIDLETKVYYNEDVKQKLANNPLLKDGVSNDVLEMTPGDAMAFASVAFDSQGMYEWATRLKDFPKMDNAFQKDLNISLKDFADGISGDGAISLFDVEYKEIRSRQRTVPQYAAVIGLNGTQSVEAIINSVPASAYELNNGIYSVNMGSADEVHMHYTEELLCISNNLKAVELFKAGKVIGKPATDDSYADLAVDNAMSAFLDLNFKNYPNAIQAEFSSSESGTIDLLDSILEKVELKTPDMNTSVVSLHFNNTSENSLKVVIEEVKNNIGTLVSLFLF